MDRRLLVRLGFVAVVVAGVMLITKIATMAFDSGVSGRRMDRAIESATMGKSRAAPAPSQPGSAEVADGAPAR